MLAHRHPVLRIAPLIAAMALGAGGMSLFWIAHGGRPFGQVVSNRQVSGQTLAAPAARPAARQVAHGTPAPAWRTVRKTRLVSRPPALRPAAAPKAKHPAAARVKARTPRKPARTHTTTTVVAAPLNGAGSGTPVAAVPAPVAVKTPAVTVPAPAPRHAAAKPRTAVTGGGAGEG
jgi:hypothetical protein